MKSHGLVNDPFHSYYSSRYYEHNEVKQALATLPGQVPWMRLNKGKKTRIIQRKKKKETKIKGRKKTFRQLI